jgi:hypothetical protein
MPKYNARFSLENEQVAFQEIKEHIESIWEERAHLYQQFRKENETLKHFIFQKKIMMVETEHAFHKEYVDLFHKFRTEIINSDPILYRIDLFNSIDPENFQARDGIKDFLTEEKISPYFELLRIDLLKGSDLVKIRESSLSGIPLPFFFVGQILEGLLWDFEHFRCIDAVKSAGVEGSIAELRKKRFVQTEWGIVWDYSPLLRRQVTKSGITVELFTEKDFIAAKKNKKTFSNLVDNFLCFIIRQAGPDARHPLFFGRDFTSTIRYTIRYQTQEVFISLELMPKWKPGIEIAAKETFLTFHTDANRDNIRTPWIKDRKKKDEQQEAFIGLLQAPSTWDEKKGPATSHILNCIKWALNTAFEKLSTEAKAEIRLQWDAYKYCDGDIEPARKNFQPRILMEKIEQSGGRLDRQAIKSGSIDSINHETLKEQFAANDDEKDGDVLGRDENPWEAEDKFIAAIDEEKKKGELPKILFENPNLLKIYEKEKTGKSLSDAERKAKQRIIEKLKQRYLSR